jgi:F-type H+-transporting ATPase subunit c
MLMNYIPGRLAHGISIADVQDEFPIFLFINISFYVNGEFGNHTVYIYRKGEKEMLRKVWKGLLTLFASTVVFLVSSPMAFAAEALPTDQNYLKVLFAIGAMVGSGIAIGCGAIGAGAGIGSAANGACQAVGRNPGVQGKIMTVMLVGMAMAESVCIYALVVSLVLLFANPFLAGPLKVLFG